MFGWLRRKFFGRSDEQESLEANETFQIDDGVVTVEEVYFAAAARFIDLQMSTNDGFDNRTSNAFSIGSTVLPVTFGLLGLSERQVPPIAIIVLALALVAYIALVVCVTLASRIRVLSYRPNMDKLQENSEVAIGLALQRWVATEYVESTEFNKPRLERKGVWVGRAIAALYAEGFLLSLAAISTLI